MSSAVVFQPLVIKAYIIHCVFFVREDCLFVVYIFAIWNLDLSLSSERFFAISFGVLRRSFLVIGINYNFSASGEHYNSVSARKLKLRFRNSTTYCIINEILKKKRNTGMRYLWYLNKSQDMWQYCANIL